MVQTAAPRAKKRRTRKRNERLWLDRGHFNSYWTSTIWLHEHLIMVRNPIAQCRLRTDCHSFSKRMTNSTGCINDGDRTRQIPNNLDEQLATQSRYVVQIRSTSCDHIHVSYTRRLTFKVTFGSSHGALSTHHPTLRLHDTYRPKHHQIFGVPTLHLAPMR